MERGATSAASTGDNPSVTTLPQCSPESCCSPKSLEKCVYPPACPRDHPGARGCVREKLGLSSPGWVCSSTMAFPLRCFWGYSKAVKSRGGKGNSAVPKQWITCSVVFNTHLVHHLQHNLGSSFNVWDRIDLLLSHPKCWISQIYGSQTPSSFCCFGAWERIFFFPFSFPIWSLVCDRAFLTPLTLSTPF